MRDQNNMVKAKGVREQWAIGKSMLQEGDH
jgi:hypothetical protein